MKKIVRIFILILFVSSIIVPCHYAIGAENENGIDVVYEYDYNIQTGELSNRRVYAEDCSPDGIAMDRDGNLWVTDCRPGNPLIAFDRAGNRVVELVFPVRRVISAAFGGENRELLFVTTAHEGAPRGKHDGGVFLLENTAGGTDEFLGTGTY